MTRDYTMHLEDILEYIDRITQALEHVTLEEFRENVDLQDATIRRFEVIGEAVKRLPKELTDRYPDIPWRKAAGFRDVMIHDYPEVVIDDVYTTAQNNLPLFREMIAKVYKSEK